MKIHFMGIGGSGMSAAAALAHHEGFDVSGCDVQVSTPYVNKLKRLGIKIYHGHSKKHLADADILAVTPAMFYTEEVDVEFEIGEQAGKVQTWQKFLGDSLLKNKNTIAISGTHGKSTTTALAATVFENTFLDPSVMIGATVSFWKSNYKTGESNIFIVESDEFYDNFLNYHPETVVLNNIEYDHPDYFKDEQQLLESFKTHIESIKKGGTLIFNQDSPGIKKLFKSLDFSKLGIKLIGYTISNNPIIKTDASYSATDIYLGTNITSFKVGSQYFSLASLGEHNISNALGVIALANCYKIPMPIIRERLLLFKGIGRRMELICSSDGIDVYDDYAHHPTAVKATLEALRQKYSKNKIWVIVEPHGFSRTKKLLEEYKNVFEHADKVIIAPIFKARDKETFGVNGESIADVSCHNDIKYIKTFEEIVSYVNKNKKHEDVIIIMGAGKSYELANALCE